MQFPGLDRDYDLLRRASAIVKVDAAVDALVRALLPFRWTRSDQ